MVRVWSEPDGTVRVTRFIEGDVAEAVAVLIEDGRVHPSATFVDLTPDQWEAMQPRRRFRPCWRWTGTGVAVDLPLAKQQRLAEIRAERNRRLDASDKDYLRAIDLGTPAEIDAMRTYRQALRDVPQIVNLDVVRDAVELEAYQPVWPVK